MSKNVLAWLLLLLLASIWGSSFILMKRGMIALDGTPLFSDIQVGALRMTIAGLILLPFSIAYIRRVKQAKKWINLAIVGFCGNFFPAFLFTYAETGISSGFAGMLNSITPIFAIFIGYLVFKQRLSSIQFIGAGIATLGVSALMIAGKQFSVDASWNHILAVVLATFMYGVSLNTIKHTLQDFKSLEITALAFFTVFVPSVLITLFSGTIETLKTVPQATEGLGFIAILSIVGTALALVIFNRLISISSTLFASSVTYFIPIVAVLMGILNHETVSLSQVLAMCVVLVGVFIANYWNVLMKSFKRSNS
jgi:drug/metabolite transporter (DMT)-like permease